MDGLAKVLRVYKVQSPSSVFLVSRDTNIFLLSLVKITYPLTSILKFCCFSKLCSEILKRLNCKKSSISSTKCKKNSKNAFGMHALHELCDAYYYSTPSLTQHLRHVSKNIPTGSAYFELYQILTGYKNKNLHSSLKTAREYDNKKDSTIPLASRLKKAKKESENDCKSP